MKRANLWMTIAILLVCAGSAFAGSITYSEQATVSGTIGANSFNNALITITFTGDTANVTGGGGFFTNDAGPGVVTVNIAGIGTATFLDNIEVFVNQGAVAAGFGDVDTGSVLDTFNNAFATYDLTTAIGPVVGAPFIRLDLNFLTTDGELNLTFSGDSTFTASTTAPVPEPSSLVFFGTSILGLAGAARRKLSR